MADAALKHRCAIAVMAKAPRAGRVKTRLCPPLRGEDCEVLTGAFLQDITANLRLAGKAAPIDGWIAYAPAGGEAAFDGLLADGTGLVLADGEGDWPAGVEGFGRCLLHAAEALFGMGYGAVCLLNADSPSLPTALLVEAAEALRRPGERVVLGPADDGGYYLLGMARPRASLFARIAWSTAGVAATTRERIAEAGLECVELPGWYDVDDAAALRRLLAELDGGAAPAPHAPFHAGATAAALARLDVRARLASLG